MVLLPAFLALLATPSAQAAPKWGFADTFQYTPGYYFIGNSGNGYQSIEGGIGANTNRIVIDWGAAEPNPPSPDGTRNYNYYYLLAVALTYEDMVKSGQRPLVQFFSSPGWANAGLPRDCDTYFKNKDGTFVIDPNTGQRIPACAYPPDAAHYGDWQAFAEFMLGVLRDQPSHTPPLGVEVWNEANVQRFFAPAPNPAIFAELARRVVLARNTAFPAGPSLVPVIAGGPAPEQENEGTKKISARNFTERLYNNVGSSNPRAYFDGLGIHPYPPSHLQLDPDTSDATFVNSMDARIDDVRQVRNQNNDGGASLWLTELGITSEGRGAARQGSILVSLYRSLDDQFKAVFFYSYFDNADPAAGPAYKFMGVRNEDGTARKYSWCILGRDLGLNACGIGYNAERPIATKDDTTNITCFQARLNGFVNPRDGRTTFYFQYWKAQNPGQTFTTGSGDAGAGVSRVPVARAITGLTRNTQYRGQLFAYNAVGQAEAEPVTFNTKDKNCN